MIRRLGFVVLVMALIVSACGRQITPNRTGTGGNTGLQPGYMSVKFRVAAPLNFSQYSYVVIFNTTGNGITPLPVGSLTNFQGYSFALIVYGSGGLAAVQAVQYARPLNSSQAPVLISLPTTPQQLQLVANDNGTGTEFTITFQRQIFAGLVIGSQSASPSPSASASPTASPSPSPSPTASGATASPAPSPTGTPPFATTWNFNYFITTPYSPTQQLLPTPVDSLGSGGPNDNTYSSPSLDTTQVFDTTFNVLQGNHPGDQGADNIVSGEIQNNP